MNLKKVLTRKKIRVQYYYLKYCIKHNNAHGIDLDCPIKYRTDFTMHKHKRYSFYILNIKKGLYNLVIRHLEKLIFENKKNLTIYISVPSKKSCKLNAEKIGLSYNKEMYFYAGGGKEEKGYFRRKQTLFFDTNLPWVKLEFYSPLRKDLDFINISINKIEIEKSNLLDIILNDTTYNFILYANVNINICDGSSIWYSSMMNILSKIGKTVVILSENINNRIIIDNVQHNKNLSFIMPSDIGLSKINISSAVKLISLLDCVLPYLQGVFVRGINEVSELIQNRQFIYRLYPYLTNIYEKKNKKIFSSEAQLDALKVIVPNATCFMNQNEEIKTYIENITGESIKSYLLPPPIDVNFDIKIKNVQDGIIKIGYAGKITPQWGIIQLLQWTKKIRTEGHDVRLTIISNKVSLPKGASKKFLMFLENELNRPWVEYIKGLPRGKVVRKMGDMDFIWCYRPAILEDCTLELSTKLVEMLAFGARCICYPNEINIKLVGQHYPWFVHNYNDFKKVLKITEYDLKEVSQKIIENHEYKKISEQMLNYFAPIRHEVPIVSFNGHDFKFIDAYISNLKSRGYSIYRDSWEWSKTNDPEWSKKCHKRSNVIFCEWGLQNAVWYSKQNNDKKKVIVRIHLQEINERARKYTRNINLNNIYKLIFVSEDVRNKALELYGWCGNKTEVIPNYVLDDQYKISFNKFQNDEIHLGMVGIVPMRKRFDIAVELLQKLIKSGKNAWLHVKGHRPENLSFMHGDSRKGELAYYENIYDIINNDEYLSQRVIFDPFANDMYSWYKKIDFILSPSDFESFHYALADGVLSGAYPLIWPWRGADNIYTSDWIVDDNEDALQKIDNFLNRNDKKEVQIKNRQLIVDKYGKEKIFKMLDKLIFD